MPVLFADIATVIQVILVLLFIVAPLVIRLISSLAQNANPPQPQRPLPPPGNRPEAVRRPPAGAAAGPRPAGRGGIDAEIEDFLKEAAARRGRRAPDEIEIVRPPERANPPPRAEPAAAAPRAPMVSAPLYAEIIEAVPVAPVEDRTARLGGEFQSLANRLDDRVELVQQETGVRFPTTFGSDLGLLSDSSAVSDHPATVTDDYFDAAHAPPGSLAAELASSFRDRTSVRRLIALTEILRRPEERW